MDTRVAAAFAAAIAVASGAAFADKPEVVVEFEIAVPVFERNLPERAEALQTVSKALATELARKYSFANWSTQSSQSPAKLGRLVLRLEQNVEMQPNPQVFVRWLGAGGKPGAELKDLKLPTLEIYSPGNPNWDTNNRRNFETRVIGKTLDKMRNDGFYAEFFPQFIKRLPIAASVVPQPTDRVIEIPVPWSELLLSSESELMVQFDKGADQAKREGSLTLTQIVARTASGDASQFPARLRGSITKGSFDARTIVLDQQNWNEQLPDMLDGARVSCFISVYKPRDELASGSDVLLGL